MKRSNFKIMNYDVMDDEPHKTTVLGYIDQEKSVGYYRDEIGWTSVDLETGLAIIIHTVTRKECEDATLKRYDHVIKIRKGDTYQKLIDKFNNAKED